MMKRRSLLLLGCAALLAQAVATPLVAQAQGADAGGDSDFFSAAQLDALLAPIALYPDELLTQTLMASTYSLQVIDAHRWLENPANSALQGDALVAALADRPWDPSVKSLIPFPQVLGMLNDQLDWMQQLGWAMTEQQPDVWASVQRLRLQAQAAGNLHNTDQQVVRVENRTIVIAPAQPNVVFVPMYNPIYVFGPWRYPAFPPVFLPWPQRYIVTTGVAVGLTFGAAVVINRSLWGWARPRWGFGTTVINVNRFNTINVNRPPANSPNWRPGGPGSTNRPGSGGNRPRPPSGPVGRPERPGNGNRPGQGGNGSRPGQGGSGNRPGQGGNAGRPGQGGSGSRPGQGGASERPGQGGNTGRPGQGGGRPTQPPPSGRPGQPNINRPPQGGGGSRPGQGGGQGGGGARPGQGGNAVRPGQGGSARPAPNPTPPAGGAGGRPGGSGGPAGGASGRPAGGGSGGGGNRGGSGGGGSRPQRPAPGN